MSKYTTEVRFICEMESGRAESGGFGDIDEIISASHNKIIGDYPIFDESYREVLNRKILRHYYTREICEETVGLWKLRLNSRMNEIMPYYNKLYKSELLNFNPLYDVDYTVNKSGDVSSDDERSKNNTFSSNETVNENDTSSKEKNIENETNRNKEISGGLDKEIARLLTDESNEQITRENTKENNATETEENSVDTSGSVSRDSNGSSIENGQNNNTGNGTVSRNNSRGQTDLYSDTPQGAITGLEEGTYLTNARKIDGNEEDTQTSNQTNSGTMKTETNTVNVENGTTDEKREESRNRTLNETEKESGNENKNVKANSGESVNETQNENRSESENGTLKIGETEDETKNKTGEKKRDENGSSLESGKVNTTEKYLEVVQGKRGGISYSQMLMEFRETFLNIDLRIIEELGDLFFGLW